MKDRILIVGNSGEIHMGSHLLKAAREIGLDGRLCDIGEAFDGPLWLSRVNWHLLGHRPNRLKEFSGKVVYECRKFRPKWLIATGTVPLESKALGVIKRSGVLSINYLTDDPWNKAHRASWFEKTLAIYDSIFSPRRANIKELERSGCQNVSYLPFAYAPQLHFPQAVTASEEKAKFDSDIVFAGGADKERIPYMSALTDAGLKVGLYGGYWECFRETRAFDRGHADPETLRKAITNCKIALCLVRRANRDDNSMRTFEIPAIGACMLTEYTDEHRAIFGSEGKNTLYFKNAAEMVAKAKYLLENRPRREELAKNANGLIVGGKHSYKDRLLAMLEFKNGQ